MTASRAQRTRSPPPVPSGPGFGPASRERHLRLEPGARVAVIGGGPAGSLFTYFLLRFARRAGLRVHADVFEPRDFAAVGPRGCNMCGGLVSGPLIEELRLEGITLPESVVQHVVDSYTLWTDAGAARVLAPSGQCRAVSVFRGGGPRDSDGSPGLGFDAFLLDLVRGMGARVIRERVTAVAWTDERPEIAVAGRPQRYDLVVVAIGATMAPGRLLADLGLPAGRPGTTSAYVTELRTDARESGVGGSTMDIVLTDIAGVDLVGIIPKGGYSTLCAIGPSVDRPAVQAMFDHPLLQRFGPGGAGLSEGACHCSPQLNVYGTGLPFKDRVVLVGDCGVTRLYKDGLGAALRTARSAAATVVHQGVSTEDLRRGYWPLYRSIARDNRYGQIVFTLLSRLRSSPRLLRASLAAVVAEQRSQRGGHRLDGVLWDLFTGASTYRSILVRACDPRLASRIGAQLIKLAFHPSSPSTPDLAPPAVRFDAHAP